MHCFTNNSPALPKGYISFSELKGFIEHYVEVFIVIALCLGYVSYVSKEELMKYEVFDSPRKSDFMYVDYLAIDPQTEHKFRYVPLKIIDVNDDGITFKVGNIAHSAPVSPTKHAKFDRAVLLRNYYRKDNLFLSHDQIEALISSGAIYNARRPRNIYISGWIVLPLHEAFVE